MYIHDGPPVCRTKDGKIVREGDPDAAFLVVAKGGMLSEDQAKAYGLMASEKPGPSQNKADVQPADATKADDGIVTTISTSNVSIDPNVAALPPIEESEYPRERTAPNTRRKKSD